MNTVIILIILICILFFIFNKKSVENFCDCNNCRCGPNCKCGSNCSCHRMQNNGCKINKEQWRIPYTAGAGGKTSDLLFHYMSPRLKLIDNTVKCNVNTHIAPVGTTSEISNVSLDIENNLIPSGPHVMSYPQSDGIMPNYCDCARALAQDSSKCN